MIFLNIKTKKKYKIAFAVTTSLLLLSSIYSYKATSDLNIKTVKVETLNKENIAVSEELKLWNENSERLRYIKRN